MFDDSTPYLTCSTQCVTTCFPDDPVTVHSTAGAKRQVTGPFPDGPYTWHEQTEARELACALDLYKLVHRRSWLTFEDVVGVLHSLGYMKH